jgi:cytochrome c oxidase subunit I+III
MFLFFNLAFFPMHLSGLLGMPRRVYTYPPDVGLETLNLMSTIGAFGFGTGVALFVINVLWSRKHGEPAGENPWEGDTLEWSEASPPPDAQFVRIPVVTTRYPLWEQPDLLPHESRLARQLEDLNARPARWRGTLITSVLDARPLAIAHMPGPTYAPFTMAVGLLAIFMWALIEEVLLLAVGGLLTIFALFLWFRPQRSEALALQEFGSRANDPERLPLAVGGTMANGWWAMLVFLAVLATALVTIIASYFYLADGRPGASEVRPSMIEPVAATILSLTTVATASWAARATRRQFPRLVHLGLAATWLLSAAALGLSVGGFPWGTLAPGASAYASSVLGVLGFQWLVLLILLVSVTIGLLWSIFRPGDPRGHAVVDNMALLTTFAAASGAVVFAVVYLSPGLW